MTDAEKLAIARSALRFYAAGTDLPYNHTMPEGWTGRDGREAVRFGDYARAALAEIENTESAPGGTGNTKGETE
jgi:hypothetical protein